MTEGEVFNFAQEAYREAAVVDIELLQQAGSSRKYYRITNGVHRSIIATQHDDATENERFIHLANFFDDKGIPVPQILAVHPTKQLYLQTDAGRQSLLDVILEEGYNAHTLALYKKSLQQLTRLQLSAKDEQFEPIFKQLPRFGSEQIFRDLQYFRQQFLSQTDLHFETALLESEFMQIAKQLDAVQDYFMYRDFQGRNIMVSVEGTICFIDFQGGMQGHPMYDVCSLLWQAKAMLPDEWKTILLDEYLQHMQAEAREYGLTINMQQWREDYAMLTLSRLLQVLGAYGLRGLQEGKAHFRSSIPLGLKNVAAWLRLYELPDYPELAEILRSISADDFIQKYSV